MSTNQHVGDLIVQYLTVPSGQCTAVFPLRILIVRTQSRVTEKWPLELLWRIVLFPTTLGKTLKQKYDVISCQA